MIIECEFSPEFRASVANAIKRFGHKHIEKQMIIDGFNPSFVRGLIKSIIRKEGW